MISQAGTSLLSKHGKDLRKIAILRASRLGDFLCATPALRALRHALPEAEITWIGLPIVRPLAERSPYIDRVIDFPGFPGIAEQFFEPERFLRFVRAMQAERFDLVLQMHGSGANSNAICRLLGGKLTAGFVRPGEEDAALAASLPYPEGHHEIRKLLALCAAIGVEPQGEELEFALREEDELAATHLLAALTGPMLGLQPGARHETKRWPPQYFAEIARALMPEFASCLILGGPDDRELGQELEERLARFGIAATSFAGTATSVPVMGAVIKRLGLLITNDSAPAHIGYALGTPTLTLFGGTSPEEWGPLTSPHARALFHPIACRPCGEKSCPIGHACLWALTPEKVTETARALLKEAATHKSALAASHAA